VGILIANGGEQSPTTIGKPWNDRKPVGNVFPIVA
jgi:hypothetical protein